MHACKENRHVLETIIAVLIILRCTVHRSFTLKSGFRPRLVKTITSMNDALIVLPVMQHGTVDCTDCNFLYLHAYGPDGKIYTSANTQLQSATQDIHTELPSSSRNGMTNDLYARTDRSVASQLMKPYNQTVCGVCFHYDTDIICFVLCLTACLSSRMSFNTCCVSSGSHWHSTCMLQRLFIGTAWKHRLAWGSRVVLPIFQSQLQHLAQHMICGTMCQSRYDVLQLEFAPLPVPLSPHNARLARVPSPHHSLSVLLSVSYRRRSPSPPPPCSVSSELHHPCL